MKTSVQTEILAQISISYQPIIILIEIWKITYGKAWDSGQDSWDHMLHKVCDEMGKDGRDETIPDKEPSHDQACKTIKHYDQNNHIPVRLA